MTRLALPPADILAHQLAADGIGGWRREVVFAPPRRWRADFAWTAERLIVEVDGGTWSGGRHTRGKGYAEDARKLNAATALGYHILRFTTDMVEDGTAIRFIKECLASPRESSALCITEASDGLGR